jgi:hypothetical protein
MAAMNQGDPNRAGDAPNKKVMMVAVAAAIWVVLLVSFSTRPPWRDPPKPGTAGFWRRLMHSQLRQRDAGITDSTDALPRTAGGR